MLIFIQKNGGSNYDWMSSTIIINNLVNNNEQSY